MDNSDCTSFVHKLQFISLRLKEIHVHSGQNIIEEEKADRMTISVSTEGGSNKAESERVRKGEKQRGKDGKMERKERREGGREGGCFS